MGIWFKVFGSLVCIGAFAATSHAGTVSAPEFSALARKCAPGVAADTMRALVKTESSFNPYAIAIIPPKGKSIKDAPKPATPLNDAKAAAKYLTDLKQNGFAYAAGLGQIFSGNFKRLGLTEESVFDPCLNLKAAATVLSDCYGRALTVSSEPGQALQKAFSCYYSDNFSTGFKEGYVERVLTNAADERQVPSVALALKAGHTVPASSEVSGHSFSSGQAPFKVQARRVQSPSLIVDLQGNKQGSTRKNPGAMPIF